MKQLLVSVPAANLAWSADDVLQVLVTEFDGTHPFVGRSDHWCEQCNRPDRDPVHTVSEVEVRVHPSAGWLPVHMAGGTVTRKEIP